MGEIFNHQQEEIKIGEDLTGGDTTTDQGRTRVNGLQINDSSSTKRIRAGGSTITSEVTVKKPIMEDNSRTDIPTTNSRTEQTCLEDFSSTWSTTTVVPAHSLRLQDNLHAAFAKEEATYITSARIRERITPETKIHLGIDQQL